MTKTYIVAPNFSVTTDSLQLGDILVHSLEPDLAPLNRKARIPIPAIDLKQVAILESFSSTRENLLSGRFGLWTTFLASLGLPVGLEFGLVFERHSKDVIKAGELHTHEFFASDEYVNQVLETAAVKMYLDEHQYRVPLYMITGLKIAKGASVNRKDEVKFDAKLGVTLPDVVAEAKPVMQIIRNRVEDVSFTSKTDFILAFHVRKIVHIDGKMQHGLSLKGASMLDGDTGEETATGKDRRGDDLSPEDVKMEAEDEGVEYIVIADDKNKETGDNVPTGRDEEKVDWVLMDF